MYYGRNRNCIAHKASQYGNFTRARRASGQPADADAAQRAEGGRCCMQSDDSHGGDDDIGGTRSGKDGGRDGVLVVPVIVLYLLQSWTYM